MVTADLDRFLDVDLLGFGEPTHSEPAFRRARDEVFKYLVTRGFRSIALEADRATILEVDAYVQGGSGAGGDDLFEWMREYNRTRPESERLTVHGFDAPLEMTHAASPVPHLRALREHLGLAGEIDDDPRWSDPRAQLDAAHSIGRTARAGELRVMADDLLTALYAQAPTDTKDWYRAYVHGVSALGLLRYHAVAADPAPPAERTSRMLGVRDALMAQNLLDIRRFGDGPVLVAAHNWHLQRNPSRWHLAGMDLEWHSAGAIVSAVLSDRYAVIVGSLGSSAALGLAPAPADTFEGGLTARIGEGPLFDTAEGTERTPWKDYFPLDADTVAQADGVWHIDLFPPEAAALADRIRRLPDVHSHQAGPGQGVPELGWDDWFFFVGDERKHPFATIVGHDVPGFDQGSRLDRAGVYRLNLDLGRDEFRRLFGYGPEEFKDRRAGLDYARFDEFVPHPVYAVQSWASIVNPRSHPDLDRLLTHAHRRGARHGRGRSGA